MVTDNNQLRQWRACRGVGGAVVAQRPHSGVVGARGGRLSNAKSGSNTNTIKVLLDLMSIITMGFWLQLLKVP
jgi:hypothetical protein